MKAIVCREYGALQLQEAAQPTSQDNEVLIKVQASAVSFNNLLTVQGKPFFVRLMGMGMRQPKHPIPGGDVAGRVEAVGRHVTQFRPGDEVFGDLADFGMGAFAEYVCAPQQAIALKPAAVSFEDAAAAAEAAVVALQGLRDKGKIQAGQKVLIYGASGGIGTFAVQLAKYFGAEVTGVCSGRNFELVRALGADQVIDYTREDFTKNGQSYDLILATAGYRSIRDYKRALSPSGSYVMTGGAWKQVFQPIFMGPFIAIGGHQKLIALVQKPSPKDLMLVGDLLVSGKLKPVIERCYPLREAAAALQQYAEGHTRGKIVITMEGDQVHG
ncbi:MAG TPA: NAD(P)-dependent alcohol dehydrogenase [Aggregatilineaceae bacterium]|nr:NAD(P)-dependent alcohol dehydrogenase [Aggregatilineaceae bacterium]